MVGAGGSFKVKDIWKGPEKAGKGRRLKSRQWACGRLSTCVDNAFSPTGLYRLPVRGGTGQRKPRLAKCASGVYGKRRPRGGARARAARADGPRLALGYRRARRLRGRRARAINVDGCRKYSQSAPGAASDNPVGSFVGAATDPKGVDMIGPMPNHLV